MGQFLCGTYRNQLKFSCIAGNIRRNAYKLEGKFTYYRGFAAQRRPIGKRSNCSLEREQ